MNSDRAVRLLEELLMLLESGRFTELGYFIVEVDLEELDRLKGEIEEELNV